MTTAQQPVRPECLLCDGDATDERFGRIRVWEDDLWRLSLSGRGYIRGFGYLEPKRHVPHITDLDGKEAATFGTVLARVTSVLKEAAQAKLVYVYVFGGGIPHSMSISGHIGTVTHWPPTSFAAKSTRSAMRAARLRW